MIFGPFAFGNVFNNAYEDVTFCGLDRGDASFNGGRNAIGVLMGIELVLNGANLNFVAFGSWVLCGESTAGIGLDGQLLALFVIVLAAAEAAVALAIALNYYHTHSTVDVDQGDELKG